MMKTLLAVAALVSWSAVHVDAAMASGANRMSERCGLEAVAKLPTRPSRSRSGSTFVQEIRHLAGAARDRAVTEQVLAGNVPDFLRHLAPVTMTGRGAGGERIDVTICVTPDYLAVGDNTDFVRVPVGLPAAASIAADLGFQLPTTKMVDAIHAQADLRLTPAPMAPTADMASTEYFWRHHGMVEAQKSRSARSIPTLIAGQKKDIVMSNRLRSKPGRVAIYGWHYPDGNPIQPLSTVHGALYADYSHGVRLVSGTAFVNGAPYPLSAILEDPQLSPIVSSEGPIRNPAELLASLR